MLLFRLSQKLASNADFSSIGFLSPRFPLGDDFTSFLLASVSSCAPHQHHQPRDMKPTHNKNKPEFIRSFRFRLLSMQRSRRGYRRLASGKFSAERRRNTSGNTFLFHDSQKDESLGKNIFSEDFPNSTSVLHSNLNIKDLVISRCSRNCSIRFREEFGKFVSFEIQAYHRSVCRSVCDSLS